MSLHGFMLLILFTLALLALCCPELELRRDWCGVLGCGQGSCPYFSSVKIEFERSGLQML